MRHFLSVLACVFAVVVPASAYYRIDGTATWSITKPDCTIQVVGAIQNFSPPSVVSGHLKLALWATLGPFPSAGKIVAEANIGPMMGGTQITDFEDTVTADLSDLTGNYQFTLVLMEYSGSFWYNRLAVPPSTHTLDRGDFLNGSAWNVRAGGFIRPVATIGAGKRLRLMTKANSELKQITAGTEADLILTFEEDNEVVLKRGSSTGKSNFSYQLGRDTLRGRKFRTGRVSLFSNGVKDAEIALFFRSAGKGTFRITGGGRVAWGNFTLR